jgi:hypothetical protein
MIFQIPVSAKQVDPNVPLGEPPVPLDDLVVELFWVQLDGRIAKDLGRQPVLNGVATFQSDPLPAQLRWAIRIQKSAVPGAVFRSGPLDKLFKPPSPIVPTGRISLLASGACFSLNDLGSDGAAHLVGQHLEQSLSFPLEFTGVDLSGDNNGNYVITVRGKLRVLFVLRRSFTYRRAVRLRGNMDPARPALPVIADLVGAAQIRGADVRRHAAVLDREIKAAVEHQLDVAVTRIAELVLDLTNSSFNAATVSASEVRVSFFPTVPEVQACMTISGGAITGIIAPPFDLAAGDQAQSASQ